MTSLFNRKPRAVALIALIAAAIPVVAFMTTGPNAVAKPVAGSGRPVLLLAVDGLSWEAFERARSLGLFRQLRYSGRHVTPYPSMSHPSWNEITGASRYFGPRGNVRTIEARWFDLDAMRAANDPRQVIARHADPYSYSRAWDYFFDPLVEPLMYLKGRKVFDRELREAERAILDEFTGERFVAYLSGLDAMAHTHRNDLWPYIRSLDSMITRVTDSLAARGRPVDLWIVSDHGNAGAFAEGAPESYLKTVSLDSAIRRAGLKRVDTGRVERPEQVSVTTIALASMVNLYFADLSRRRAFAEQALKVTGVNMVTWFEVTASDRHVVILGRDGEARLRWQKGEYSYERVRGNPLALPDSLSSGRGERRWFSDARMRAATIWGPYPDALYRIARSADKHVENAPDLIVNLSDGYAHKGDLGRFVRMVRTHGSLGARPSQGVLAGNTRPVPTHVRSEEVLGVIGLRPEELFERTADLGPRDPLALARAVARGPHTLPTQKSDASLDARFLRRARPIVLSMDYFRLDALGALASAVKNSDGSDRVKRTRAIIDRSDIANGVAGNVDTLLSIFDSLDTKRVGVVAKRAEARAREIPELAPLAELRSVWSRGSDAPGGGAPVRRAAMAAWTVPYFLDAALAAPEWDSIPDPRDAGFAVQWHSGLRARVASNPARLLDDTALAPKLFAEVFAERRVMRALEPATLPAIYDPDVSDLTVVFVPGLYDELFDGELWSRGLRSVRNRLAARTVTMPTDGRCSSEFNARRILSALHDDTRRRLERGYGEPRYLVLGYSKGGVDAVEALALEPEFTRAQVVGFVSLAAPQRGTPVAERSDVPAGLLKWGITSRPACDSSGATPSLWPMTRSAFWAARDGGRSIAQLTRFYSLSFVTSAEKAHPWMKLTKQIGQFREENDGVVALSSSRFPAAVNAVDLGVVEADHIAGRLASSFPQDAFLEAVVVAVAELGGAQRESAAKWRGLIASRDASVWLALRRRWAADEGDSFTRFAAFPASLRAPSRLPGGSTGWTATKTFRTGGGEQFEDVDVRPMTLAAHPGGVQLRCDQRNMEAFRREYEFFYDAGNGGGDDQSASGFAIVGAPDLASGRACRLASGATAMKMTSVAYRFRPADFSDLRLSLRVARTLQGVDDGKSANGVNDAPFKLWFILRDTRPASSGQTVLFGYVWPGTDTRGTRPADGTLIEARSSRRNLVVTTLPEAWQVAIGPRATAGWTHIQRDMAADLARAYPGIPTSALQVVGITIQTDSDDSRGATEVYLESLDITAKEKGGPKAARIASRD